MRMICVYPCVMGIYRYAHLQAISTAPQLAAATGQQLVQPEHLAKALLEQVRHVLTLYTLPSDHPVTVQPFQHNWQR